MIFSIRAATTSDIEAIRVLIEDSARRLGAAYYSAEQIEAALESAWGVDTQLIVDQTYYVVESRDAIVGCGGWSYRSTLFGNDMEKDRSTDEIDPGSGAAKIRAFFVSPDYARRGIARMILLKCEAEAARRGFHRFELMATLPGINFYERQGFVAGQPIAYLLSPNLSIKFVPMKKDA